MATASCFTPRAQQVLALARREADRLNHNFLGTEHLLLGIIELGQGTAVNVLKKRGLDLDAIGLEVEKQVGTGPAERMLGNVPYTPRVKKVLALAQKEAKQFNHAYVGTEHLLLGLLREGDGVAAVVLRSLDVHLEQTRLDILREVDPNVSGSSIAERTTPISNFTPRAQQVLTLAREEAQRLNHNFLGTEHLLLGLVKLKQGVAVTVLARLGLNLETVRQEVEKQVGAGPNANTLGDTPYTPHVKKVIALAQQEARHLNHTFVGTEHLLLGLLREGDGVAAKVLRALEVDLDQTRTEILRILDPNFSGNRFDERINTPVKESEAMKSPYERPQVPDSDSVGSIKRYDIYCTERSTDIVVYRNARFKGIKWLHSNGQYDSMGQFIELEQADGQAIFVSRFSVIKFCEPGATPGGETILPPKS